MSENTSSTASKYLSDQADDYQNLSIKAPPEYTTFYDSVAVALRHTQIAFEHLHDEAASDADAKGCPDDELVFDTDSIKKWSPGERLVDDTILITGTDDFNEAINIAVIEAGFEHDRYRHLAEKAYGIIWAVRFMADLPPQIIELADVWVDEAEELLLED